MQRAKLYSITAAKYPVGPAVVVAVIAEAEAEPPAAVVAAKQPLLLL
jgi:hypothetical protein